MLNLLYIERIQASLRSVPTLVDSQQRRQHSFPEEVLAWLKETEKVLEQAKVHIVSEVASLRSRLLLTLHRSEENDQRRVSNRKRREAIASEVLQAAQQLILHSISHRLDQLQEAETIALRIVSVARAKGIIAQAEKIQPHQEALRFLQQAMSQDSDTAAAMVHLAGILGAFDVLVVLDQMTPELTNN